MKYRKKPVEIEAIQWKGNNLGELVGFVGAKTIEMISKTPYIKTLEGKMMLSEGDYIIKGVVGEFYPCKPDIFEQTYERV